jgi:hypothetical protein
VNFEDLNGPLTAALETGAKPTVAAITGAALGGGLEVAMACNARVCELPSGPLRSLRRTLQLIRHPLVRPTPLAAPPQLPAVSHHPPSLASRLPGSLRASRLSLPPAEVHGSVSDGVAVVGTFLTPCQWMGSERE